jgi:hypothetical protein
MLKEEKWDFGFLGISFLTIKLPTFKNEKLPFRTNIPIFHHSIAPCMRQNSGLVKSLYFQQFVEIPRR